MSHKPIDMATLIARSEAIEAAVQEAVREALEVHKRAGNPVVVWENEELHWISAQELLDSFDAPAQ
jgi:hypothetical protein